ncbi:MAG: UDP-N-acetylmuramoyl-L-alanyl-D-glutamate--2,6-diaminopimelate ligase [Flavobacteriales bacterium]
MKILSDILYRTRIQEVVGSTNIAAEHITFDSREAKPYSLFVAVRGVQVDGHNYIASAVEKGAIAVVCEVLPNETLDSVTYVQVGNSAEALGLMAANFYDHPSKRIQVVGITGTNGKTTTTTLLHRMYRQFGVKCGLISTVANRINDRILPATHTTPDALSIQALLAEMVEQGCTHCFMEASSHAIHQHRTTGIHYAGAVFTNITHDHLDYHGSFNEYIKAKKALFDRLPAQAFALVNVDDSHGEIMVQNCKARKRSFALHSMADYKAKVLENQFSGLQLSMDGQDVYSKLIGGFNAYNLLTVYAVCMELGMDKMDALTHLSTLDSVDGRFEYFRTPGGVTAVVDYAHTPDALSNVLSTIEAIRTGNEQVITVVGCGGDRDKAKRPEMARIAADNSDRVLLTSDNPRSEKPEDILADMQAGLDPVHARKTLSITDRREAIRTACALSEPGDIILIAGKGHEKYQEIAGERFSFDDLEVVQETLKTLAK